MSAYLQSVVQLSNDRVRGDTCDHFTVSLDGVLLLDSPIYGRALDLAVRCRNDIDQLRKAVHDRIAELGQQLEQAVTAQDIDDATDLGNELLRLRWTWSRIHDTHRKKEAA